MKRAAFLLDAMATAVVVASGVALAVSIQCPNREDGTCVGTPNGDRITGTPDPDFIRARGGGGDVLGARGGADLSIGGAGADRVRGQAGPDEVLGGSLSFDPVSGLFSFVDAQDDVVRGGDGDDPTVAGGFGRGGRDRLYGGDGDDTLYSAQRGFPLPGDVRINRETVDCGPGQDTAYVDRGVDEVKGNCETVVDGFPATAAARGSSGAGLFGGAPE
jgi:Ca2+-binding RTX toxin-like protein